MHDLIGNIDDKYIYSWPSDSPLYVNVMVKTDQFLKNQTFSRNFGQLLH